MNKNCQRHIDLIDAMLLDESFTFADTTLQGIRKVIKEREKITDNQVAAIENILKSKPMSDTYCDWENGGFK
jgi:hypothetical protein